MMLTPLLLIVENTDLCYCKPCSCQEKTRWRTDCFGWCAIP